MNLKTFVNVKFVLTVMLICVHRLVTLAVFPIPSHPPLSGGLRANLVSSMFYHAILSTDSRFFFLFWCVQRANLNWQTNRKQPIMRFAQRSFHLSYSCNANSIFTSFHINRHRTPLGILPTACNKKKKKLPEPVLLDAVVYTVLKQKLTRDVTRAPGRVEN